MYHHAPKPEYLYLYAHVLLLSWDKADERFGQELDRIEHVFRSDYNFTTEKWKIPSTNSLTQLTRRILDFLDRDGPDTLLILYYGGHGYSNTDKHLLWACYSDGLPAVDWSALRLHFSQRQADILMILDCCSAVSLIGERHEGMVELLLACGVDMKTLLSGKSCFTRKVAEKLRECFADGIEVYDIYHSLSRDYNNCSSNNNNNSSARVGGPPFHLYQGKETRSVWLRRMESFYSARSRFSAQRSISTGSIRPSLLRGFRGSVADKQSCDRQTVGSSAYCDARDHQSEDSDHYPMHPADCLTRHAQVSGTHSPYPVANQIFVQAHREPPQHGPAFGAYPLRRVFGRRNSVSRTPAYNKNPDHTGPVLSCDHVEWRTKSVDGRTWRPRPASQTELVPRAIIPDSHGGQSTPSAAPEDEEPADRAQFLLDRLPGPYDDADAASATDDAHSTSSSQDEALVGEEMARTWFLNRSVLFGERLEREKLFVTYRETATLWRRVTISLNYWNAPPNSLEMDLLHTCFQLDRSAKVYEAIREFLRDIRFYETVTNLKLETIRGRLFVHVIEDGNEIISYPRVRQVQHLGCRRVRDRDVAFDSHISGFVYKVVVDGEVLVKKELPGPDAVDDFLCEMYALSQLRSSDNVIRLHSVVVDDGDEYVKGFVTSCAKQGNLVDVIRSRADTCHNHGGIGITWSTRMRWARQIVGGLSDIHDAGLVHGGFTLSTVAIDDGGDAKIADVCKRSGFPVGWEAPEAIRIIGCNKRAPIHSSVKSDLYQLGMVLWALMTLEPEPEARGRPLMLAANDELAANNDVDIPDWYRRVVCIYLPKRGSA